MKMARDTNGLWHEITEPGDTKAENASFREALPRYLNAFDALFAAAAERSEFGFIECLLRVRGFQDAGWDPYETTLRTVDALVKVHEAIQEAEPARHLHLWIYGHIVEASEPYELLANLLEVANGGRFRVNRFPRVRASAKHPGRPQSPGEKIGRILATARAVKIPQVAEPLDEIWDRDLRNAVFHADYTFHGAELRLLDPARIYSLEDELRLVNRALAYHASLQALNEGYRARYKAPIQIALPPGFSCDPEELATVMVKDGWGVIGLKDSWTPEQIAAGKVPFCIARLTQQDTRLQRQDPTRAHFPAEATGASQHSGADE